MFRWYLKDGNKGKLKLVVVDVVDDDDDDEASDSSNKISCQDKSCTSDCKVVCICLVKTILDDDDDNKDELGEDVVPVVPVVVKKGKLVVVGGGILRDKVAAAAAVVVVDVLDATVVDSSISLAFALFHSTSSCSLLVTVAFGSVDGVVVVLVAVVVVVVVDAEVVEMDSSSLDLKTVV